MESELVKLAGCFEFGGLNIWRGSCMCTRAWSWSIWTSNTLRTGKQVSKASIASNSRGILFSGKDSSSISLW